MIRLVLGGAGKNARLAERYLDFEKVSVMAYVDNDESKWYKTRYVRENEVKIYPVRQLEKFQFDYILVTMERDSEFISQLSLEGYSERIIRLMRKDEENQKLLKKIMVHNYWLQPHKYQIGNHFIDLGEAMLQRYQHSFPMFDTIIEAIAQTLTVNHESWIVDIGANVGDTLFIMLQYTEANILAVEPMDKYYQLLTKNVMSADIYDRQIILENSFIALDGGKHYEAEASNGTAVMVYNPDEKETRVRSVSMLELLMEKEISFDNIRFIKCDTDGYDANCLMSCGEGLKRSDIWVYWENYLLPDCSNYEKLSALYKYLDEMEYKTFYIFDNYGNFLCKGGVDICYGINAYLKRINSGWSERTFHYVDILGCKNEEKANKMIFEHLKKYR